MGADEVVARLRAAGCVYAEQEAALLRAAAAGPVELAEMVERRAAGEPLEHVVGWADFCGLRVTVGPGVFVPRRRSELLVREAARHAAALSDPVVVDLCCGSGALGLAVVAALPGAELHASDVDPVAVACARENLGGRGTVYEGDLARALPPALAGRVDVLVANVPYVPHDEIPLLPTEARVHEPHAALDGGPDGLAVLERVMTLAPTWLRPGAAVLCEVSDRQVPRAVDVARRAGLAVEVTHDDGLGATVVTGRRPHEPQASQRTGKT